MTTVTEEPVRVSEKIIGTATVEGEDEVTIALRKARGLLEKGWIQNSYRLGNSFCVLGAIDAAANLRLGPDGWSPKTNLMSEMRRRLAKAIFNRKMPLGETHQAIPAWNDSPFRRKEHVLAAFDRAIADRRKS